MIKYRPGLFLVFILLSLFGWISAQTVRGRLPNPGFENQYIKSTFFFAGNWRNGAQFYEYNPSDNTGLYTLHPSDFRHLGWSENLSYRNFAVNSMIEAGVNVINMSYWGLRGTDNWAYWSPMQTSTLAHDELFNVALGKDILVAPYIESFAPTDYSDGFSFRDCFPGDTIDPAPPMVAMIEDLIDRYLAHPENHSWPEVWARAYDQDGIPRYVISLIHVASDQAGINEKTFSEGFDRIANLVFRKTGFHIGFLLDALPVATYSPGNFKIIPENAGLWLASQKSILGIQCFIPEIWTGLNNNIDLIAWKRNYSFLWNSTTIPFIMDVSPGYDAHIIFPGSMIYGNSQAWRDSLTQIVKDIRADGITINTWNGYTEGFAIVPTLEYDDINYNWATGIFNMYTIPEIPNHAEQFVSAANKLLLYPDPVSNEVRFRSDFSFAENLKYAVYSFYGNLIMEGQLLSSERIIPVQHLSEGIYLVNLVEDSGIIHTFKFIKAE